MSDKEKGKVTEEVSISGEDKLAEEMGVSEEEYYSASQWQLMRWRFKKHQLAIIGLVIVLFMYTLAVFCGFIAPGNPNNYKAQNRNLPPTKIRWLDKEGNFHFRPFFYNWTARVDPSTFEYTTVEDYSKRYPVYFIVRGEEYNFWGLFKSNLHLFGPGTTEGKMYLFGSDNYGRGIMSMVIYGARISMSIGLVGVLLSTSLGILIGGISGFAGGHVDDLIQRIIEVMMSFPRIPLWMALTAALPAGWSIIKIYFSITVILSILGWTGLARVVRGKFIALREEDFVTAADLAGSSRLRIIFKHMLPSFMSHIIASLTLSIPGMIIGETGLSFLGLGLRPPAISWGVLLKEAQNIQALGLQPWLLTPGIFVIITVLAFNFVGDGLRDAADPYSY